MINSSPKKRFARKCSLTFCIFLAIVGYLLGGERCTQLYYVAYFQSRAIMHDGMGMPTVTPKLEGAGVITGITRTADVQFDFGGESQFAGLADVKIVEMDRFFDFIRPYIQQERELFIDVYQLGTGESKESWNVLWDEQHNPVNLAIVDRRIGEATETPVTNIVNTVYARHYWKLFEDSLK